MKNYIKNKVKLIFWNNFYLPWNEVYIENQKKIDEIIKNKNFLLINLPLVFEYWNITDKEVDKFLWKIDNLIFKISKDILNFDFNINNLEKEFYYYSVDKDVEIEIIINFLIIDIIQITKYHFEFIKKDNWFFKSIYYKFKYFSKLKNIKWKILKTNIPLINTISNLYKNLYNSYKFQEDLEPILYSFVKYFYHFHLVKKEVYENSIKYEIFNFKFTRK